MSKAIVIFGSTMGNTETLAGSVVEGLEEGGKEVTLKNVTETKIKEVADYDLVVMGCSTWGLGELQDDFISFYDAMSKDFLDGKKAAVFGPGDSGMYPDNFCDAVTIIEEKLEECGAKIVEDCLKVDGDVDDALDETKAWAVSVAKNA
ncbi:MAG: flavodoxin [Clostridiales bacterium]|nr:flavodoxin [Clostridiales bacterium]